MALFRCKMCGGDLEIAQGITIAECEYCGAKQTVPKCMDENLQNLFNRANTLRIKCQFDKAEKLYEKIIQVDASQSEAYWGLILCKYGIEYVDDPTTFQKIPTCHRTSYDSIIADEDYKSALENAEIGQRAVYEEQAKEIDKIQKDILALAQKEEQYDVFICYKETDNDGYRTQDSVIANDIYYQLTQENFKVFYATITLEGKLGSAYEPIIFAALNSAKVMLTIGTRPEYFTSVWVKNEWSRFLKIIQKDRSKLLIPCYRDMDPYELPEEFSHLQALDMAKIGFINDLVRGIKKIIKPDVTKATDLMKENVSLGSSVNIATLLKRVFMFLEDGDWNSADEYCEKVLDIDPECAHAYLGKLMAQLHVKRQQDLNECVASFDDNSNYQKTIRFADDSLKNELSEYINNIRIRNENERLANTYDKAMYVMNSAETENEYRTAAFLFESIKGYKDSDDLASRCFEDAESARKDAVLAIAKSKMTGKDVDNYKSAIELFRHISGWKDADSQILSCEQEILAIEKRIKRIKREIRIALITVLIEIVVIGVVILADQVFLPGIEYKDAIELMNEGKYAEAIDIFEELDGYKNSESKIEECEEAILEDKYNKAVAFASEGKFDEAYDIFVALGDYKDSVQRAENIRLTKAKESMKDIEVGDYLTFGAYEQDNDVSNGTEDIEWIVLDVKDGRALLVSKYAIDCIPYNEIYTDATWESCSLRYWLNNTFLHAAFSNTENEMIQWAFVPADENSRYSTTTGNDTNDKIFILSIKEVNLYLNSTDVRDCQPTNYAVANGAYESGDKDCYWLRAPGIIRSRAAVMSRGDINENGYNVDYHHGAVRPALWIDITK